VESHARLGYLIGDVGLVAPLALASWYGLLEGRTWGVPVFLFTAGAFAYDILHFGIYLAQEEFLSAAPLVWIVATIAVLGVITAFAGRELISILRQPGREPAVGPELAVGER
jgi:hypothetical protein